MPLDWKKLWEEDQGRRRGNIQPQYYYIQDQAKFLIHIIEEGSRSTDWNLLLLAMDELVAQIDDEVVNISEAERERRREARLSVLKFNQFVESQLADPSFAFTHVSNNDQSIQRQIDDFFNAFLETDYGRALQPLLNADTFAEYLGNGFRTVQKALYERRRLWPREYCLNPVGDDGNHRLPSYSEAIHKILLPRVDCKTHPKDTPCWSRLQKDDEISYCPPFRPPNYRSESQRPPEYQGPQHILARSRYNGDYWRTSEDSIPPETFCGPEVPLNTSIDCLRTHFATDPRSKHTSQTAGVLGIRKSSSVTARKVTPRRYTDGEQGYIDFTKSFEKLTPNAPGNTQFSGDDMSHVKARRRSLVLISSEDYITGSSRTNSRGKEDMDASTSLVVCYDLNNSDTHSSEEHTSNKGVDLEQTRSCHMSSAYGPLFDDEESLSLESASFFSWAKSVSIEFKSDSEVNHSESIAFSVNSTSERFQENLGFLEGVSSTDGEVSESWAVSHDHFNLDQESEAHLSHVNEDKSKGVPSELGDICNVLQQIAEASNSAPDVPDRFERIISSQNRTRHILADHHGLKSPSNEIETRAGTKESETVLVPPKYNLKYKELVANKGEIDANSVLSTSPTTWPWTASGSFLSPSSSKSGPSSSSDPFGYISLMRGGGLVAHSSPSDLEPSAKSLAMDRRIAGIIRTVRSFGKLPRDLRWTLRFINSRGNEYFCDVDEEYLTDRFNLTGLNTEVQYYQYALDLITDVFDLDCDDEVREQIEKSARHLYGLVHARYIATNRGLQKMMEKFKNGDFGKCPRVACLGQYLLPTGQSDIANVAPVKLYCARCEDLYNPKSPRHSAIDGAYFGSSFPHILFQVYPQALPEKSQKRYEPRIYGFRVHAAATLARWQTEKKEEMKSRLTEQGLETGFEEEEMEDEMEFEEEDEVAQDGIDDMFEGRRASSGTIRR